MDYGKSDTLLPILFLCKNVLGWNQSFGKFFFEISKIRRYNIFLN